MNKIKINTEYIKLDQLLKFIGIVDSCGQAKQIILDGLVLVNSVIVIQRGKKIYPEYSIEFDGVIYFIEKE